MTVGCERSCGVARITAAELVTVRQEQRPGLQMGQSAGALRLVENARETRERMGWRLDGDEDVIGICVVAHFQR